VSTPPSLAGLIGQRVEPRYYLSFLAAPAHGATFLWVELEFDLSDKPMIGSNVATPY